MQQHQEWLENRNYAHHLKSLCDIRKSSRKHLRIATCSKTKIKNKCSYSCETQNLQPTPNNIIKQSNTCSKIMKCHKKDEQKMDNRFSSLKERQLLLDNFLLGKRILQTPPVISFDKNERDYQKNKKIIESRKFRVKKKQANQCFRNSKLHEYTEATERISNFYRLPTSTTNRQIIELRIKDIHLDRQKRVQLENVALKYSVIDQKYKRNQEQQVSEIVSLDNLLNYQFYFRLPARHLRRIREKQNSHYPRLLLFEIYEVKGLEEYFFGEFVLEQSQVTQKPATWTVGISRAGREIGSVTAEFCCVARRNLIMSM